MKTGIASYLGAFILGAYTASQIKFQTPIEDYRWVLTGFVTVVMIILTFVKDKPAR